MGQSASIETPASAPQQMSNVLPVDATQRVRVQCLEISNGTLEKLQALLRSGCDAAMLDSLPCQVVDTTSAVTIAELRGSITAPVAVGSAESKPLHLFAVRKTAEASTAMNEDEANGVVPLPPTMTVQDVLACPDIASFTEADGSCTLLLLHSHDATLGDDMMGMCCIAALIAACCACCIGLCCCGAAAMKKKPANASNNNNTNSNVNYNQNQGNGGYNNNNTNYNNNNNNNNAYTANPNYGGQPTNNYGLPPNQGQQYQNNNNGYNTNNNGGYQQQPQTNGPAGNPLQPAPL